VLLRLQFIAGITHGIDGWKHFVPDYYLWSQREHHDKYFAAGLFCRIAQAKGPLAGPRSSGKNGY
jgi:hypothetical protein